MILDTIVFTNFAIYGGRQEVELTPLSESQPIILFGGMNGGGKTTLLDAFQLAFYGPKARCSSRGKLSYTAFLRSTIHRGSSPSEGASIEVRFRRAVDGITRSYAITRSWRETEKGIEERIKVLRDGEVDPLLGQHWEEYIENYIPSGIAHLFFFDAEQIKELAEGEHAAELLGTAIHSLLGLDLVDRLQTNLIALERRKLTEHRTGEEARRAKKAQDDVERLQTALDKAVMEKGVLQNHADRIGKALLKSAEKFRLEGGELFSRRGEMQSEKVRLHQQLTAHEMAMRDLADSACPLLLVSNLLNDAESQIRSEANRHKADVLVSALEDRDAKILTALRKLDLESHSLKAFEKILNDDRLERKATNSQPPFLKADDHVATELRHLRTTVLPEQSKRLHEKFDSATDLADALARLDVELARVPDEVMIAGLQRDLQSFQVQHAEKLAEVATHGAKLDVLVRQHAAAESALKRELGEDVDQEIEKEDQDRVVKHSAKVRSTLSKFRTAIIRKHTSHIEHLMLDSFHQLLRKKSLISKLSIDPETFAIELCGGDGDPLPFDQLSSGERQLLATSLLWGLARACGRPIPTIIDTPLGRLDSSHRMHLIERYFPVASHQVILLSTDEEIDRDNLNQLQPYIGRSYHLQFNETDRSTTVMPGYFWTHEATS